MNEIKCTENNGVFTVKLSGRVDSSNSTAVEAEISAAKGTFSGFEALIDASGLEYISSAGLRIILRLKKEFPELKMIGVSADVYDILEMTGFTEIITVEKAYRELSVEGCEVIGVGANGKVYRLDSDTIIKVYFRSDCLPDIKRERELARKAFVLGIPTAIPYDVVKVGDSYGSVFELLNARSFTKILTDEPEKIDEVAKMYVELLKKIHSTEVSPDDMPDMKKTVLAWVEFLKDRLPENTWNRLYGLVNAVPDSNRMIHGDYHTKNVMVQNGEVLLIDMDTLARGNAVFEFASIFNAFVGFYSLTPSLRGSFIGLNPDTALDFWEKTLKLYFETDDEITLGRIRDKAKLIGYIRLMRRTIRRKGFDNEESRQEIDYYKNRIIELTDSIDNLCLN